MTDYGYTIKDTDGHTYRFIFPEKDRSAFECHLPIPAGKWAFIAKWHIEHHPDWRFYLDNKEHPLVVRNKALKLQRELNRKKQLACYDFAHEHGCSCSACTEPVTALVKICDDCNTETLGYGNEEHFNGVVLCHWCLELRLITDLNQAKHPPKRDLFVPGMIALSLTIFILGLLLNKGTL